MAIGGQNTRGNLVTPARQLTWNATYKRAYIVRIVGNLKLGAASIWTDERDLAQLGNNLLAEDEANRFGRLREMTVRRRC